MLSQLTPEGTRPLSTSRSLISAISRTKLGLIPTQSQLSQSNPRIRNGGPPITRCQAYDKTAMDRQEIFRSLDHL